MTKQELRTATDDELLAFVDSHYFGPELAPLWSGWSLKRAQHDPLITLKQSLVEFLRKHIDEVHARSL